MKRQRPFCVEWRAMSDDILLRVKGEVEESVELSFTDLEAIDDSNRIIDVSQFDPKRKGDAIKLTGLLDLTGVHPTAKYIGLHGTLDNFHASIPLEPVREKAFLIYRVDGLPLDVKAAAPSAFTSPTTRLSHRRDRRMCQCEVRRSHRVHGRERIRQPTR